MIRSHKFLSIELQGHVWVKDGARTRKVPDPQSGESTIPLQSPFKFSCKVSNLKSAESKSAVLPVTPHENVLWDRRVSISMRFGFTDRPTSPGHYPVKEKYNQVSVFQFIICLIPNPIINALLTCSICLGFILDGNNDLLGLPSSAKMS